MKTFITSASLTLFWLFSPDALVLAGNGAGKGGWSFFLFFLFALVLSSWSAWLLSPPTMRQENKPSSGSSTSLFGTIQNFALLALTIGCCLSLVLFIPVGTLVTAGFTFNETFLYWFPNFGFSFLLLGCVLFIHLWSEKMVVAAQIYFFTTTYCCLSILAIYGLVTGTINLPTAASSSDQLLAPVSRTSLGVLFCTPLLLFLGHEQQDHHDPSSPSRLLILLSGAGVIGIWCAASLLHVPQNKLASSTIPYILGAREILGQTGRILMGVTIISGTLCVVNGLLIYASRTLRRQLSESTSLPPLTSLWYQRIFALLVSVLIGASLAMGVAGEDRLETYIHGSLLLWLLLTAGKTIAAQRTHEKPSSSWSPHFLLPALLALSFFYLVFSHSDKSTLLLHLSLVLVVAMVIATAMQIILRRMAIRATVRSSPESCLKAKLKS